MVKNEISYYFLNSCFTIKRVFEGKLTNIVLLKILMAGPWDNIYKIVDGNEEHMPVDGPNVHRWSINCHLVQSAMNNLLVQHYLTLIQYNKVWNKMGQNPELTLYIFYFMKICFFIYHYHK